MRKKLLWTILLMALLINVAAVTTVSAPALPVVSVEPRMIWDTSMVPPAEFTVEICVDYVERLWAYQFELGKAQFGIAGWNPLVLRLKSFADGGFLGSAGGRVVFFPGTVDQDMGTLTLTGAALDPNRRWPSGGGVLATLTFEVVGEGSSSIYLSMDTGLLNPLGQWIVRGTYNPENIVSGVFCNLAEGPELYIRTKGAHGGGVWPAWQVGLIGDQQTLYSKIMNYGELGAYVKVKMSVYSPAHGTEEYMTSEAWCPAAYWTPQGDIVPGEVTVSVSFTPPGVARYTVNGVLFFRLEGMTVGIPYTLVVDMLGGIAESRDVAEGYKVVLKV